MPPVRTNSPFRRALLLAGIAAGASSVACGGADSTGPGTRTAASVELTNGNNQSATVATAVPIAPTVLVRDGDGAPLPGATVNFVPAAGSGTAVPASAVTDANGTARATSWVLGQSAGPQRLRVTVAGLSGDSVVFQAIALAGAASSVAKIAGDGQQAVVGTSVGAAPTAEVRDAFGNPVANVAVTFLVASGGGVVVAPTTVTTGGNGRAVVGGWTLGTVAGPNTLSATAAGVATPAVFSATGLSGQPVGLTIAAGNGQSVAVGTIVPTAPAVDITDAYGNPVPSVSVTFVVASGGGVVSGGVATSNAAGRATVGSWRLGTVVGSNSLTAAVGGFAITPVTFAATGTPGAAQSLALTSGNNQSGPAGLLLANPLSVRVTDAYGNNVPGADVGFSPLTGGGGVTTNSATTDAAGLASTGWTLGPQIGAQTLQASAPGLSGSPILFSATATGKTWIGSISSNWSTAGNWQPSGVPTAQDTVFIPAAVTAPQLTASVSVAGVRVTGGDLRIGGQTLNIAGSLIVSAGTLTMTNSGDQVIVGGDATFSGASAVGHLTAGTLRVRGDFLQGGGPVESSFAASGTHRTVLDGVSSQNITLSVPGPMKSHFQHLDITNSTYVGANYLYVAGRLTVTTPIVVGSTTYFVVGRTSTIAGSELAGGYGFFNGDSLAVGGSFSVGEVVITGGQTLPALEWTDLTIQTGGAIMLAGSIDLYRLTVADGDLIMNGRTIATGEFYVRGPNAFLTMTSPSDSIVTSSFLADGGDSRGRLTAGTIVLSGPFAQDATNSQFSFAASGAHRMKFELTREQPLYFATPGAARLPPPGGRVGG